MIYRLKRNIEFRIVYRHGKSIANNLLVLYVLKNKKNKDKNEGSYNRVGISVSKKVGNSVVRSRCKRLITESYRIKTDNLKNGYDLIFVARTNIKDKDYYQVNKAVEGLLKKAGLYNNEKISD
ncbi:MAG: ribonuclease P protein component [Clostridium sp.]|uniref:ribonuclease P protein component n=1 Tax=Clostridium sp. DSM 8431 TaxID=1761781 RepID=UPI0008EBC039|nr:ribonuclease P protein component [Clostridium sp. DSM 8431]MCR4943116.1 ribonuclease P protein component [Clostridium sp.]SFU61325.1 ribonuclease P protein component [Clostridium sp. DSM 8431]